MNCTALYCGNIQVVSLVVARQGTSQSWGLRLVGGSDVGLVVRVEKVRYFKFLQIRR